MSRSSIVIVSPALAEANNGNWQTASRWREMLAARHEARIVKRWPDEAAAGDDIMLALHARKSADSVQAWVAARGSRGLAVVLTGTDLYQDIAYDASAQASLDSAARLVVLQEMGVAALPAQHGAKARVIYQSTSALEPLDKPRDFLGAVMVGHLREVKSPQTLFEAAVLLKDRPDIRIDHIGEASEPLWAERAQAAMAASPHYHWLGSVPHEDTRRAIQRAHVLVHTSALEGGAHVIMEAVRSGTAVLASRVSGNLGMLGADYEGYFPHGDAAALAALLARCRDESARGAKDPAASLLARLGRQCRLRAPLFAPEAEQASLLQLIQDIQDDTP
ncbi:MAG TPA: selenoneine biosynthesis selenosugar synthase SenB [Ramlibacter sp.]|nr:selenoneine biosynthesis selenosugar synthase SenB [Ramlibacter sp.]